MWVVEHVALKLSNKFRMSLAKGFISIIQSFLSILNIDIWSSPSKFLVFSAERATLDQRRPLIVAFVMSSPMSIQTHPLIFQLN